MLFNIQENAGTLQASIALDVYKDLKFVLLTIGNENLMSKQPLEPVRKLLMTKLTLD